MKMGQKFLGLCLVTSMIFQIIAPTMVARAVGTNGTSSPWTIEKAEHLAKRALLGPNLDVIQQLYNAGSAQSAVNVLFPSISGPSRTQYDFELAEFKAKNFSPTDAGQMRRYYAFQYLRDPYEAKKKFFSLFEDIFALDRKDDILYTDVENHFEILYGETLGNYKKMMKRVLFDTQKSEGSFAMGKYLDLLNQPNKDAPNENYAREMMQLFLMGEYKPWENGDTPGAVRNYTEEDVAAFARLLTGFRAETDKKVYFDPAFHHTGTGVAFLTGALKSGISFPFYDATTNLINNTLTPNVISGNNGLGDNMVDYIFAKRENEIAYFLAWRMLKFYVQDKPSQLDIQIVANQILMNNFELYQTVKWLLASDIMYSDVSMNSQRFKNPLELSIGTLKLLTYKQPNLYNNLVNDTVLLTTLDWTPHQTFSIFGRAGFDQNDNFMNPYTHNQWVTYAHKIAFDTSVSTGATTYSIADLVPITRITGEQTGEIPVRSHTGNTYSGSIDISSIQLNLLQDFDVQDSINTVSSSFIIDENQPKAEVLSAIENEISEMSLSDGIMEIPLVSENINEEVIPEIIPDTLTGEVISEEKSPELIPETQSGEIIDEGVTPEIIPETLTGEVISEEKSPELIPETQSGEIIDEEVIPENTPETSTGDSTEEETLPKISTFAAPLLQEAAVSSKTVTLSGSIDFPSFRIKTQSGGVINFSGSIQFDTNKIIISSGTFTFSGKVYDITSGEVLLSQKPSLQRDITPDELLDQLQNSLYFGKKLPETVRNEIKNYLLLDQLGNQRVFLPNNATYVNKYIRGVIAMMLVQPEFMMQSGYDIETSQGGNGSSLIPNSPSKLVMVELYGGYDWLNAMVPKSEYNTTYQTTRSGMILTPENVIDVGDYYMNKSFEPFKTFLDSGELKIFNRVGAPNHSRGHDTAAIQIASKYALQTYQTPGVIGDIIKNETDASKNIVLGSSRPNVYTLGRYLNIGGNSVLYKVNSGPQNNDEKLYQINTLKSILKNRSYPGKTTELFQNSLIVDKVGTDSKNSGGLEGSGNNTKQRLAFLSSLISNNVGVTYYVPGGGGYDTHGDQQKEGVYNLNSRTGDLAKDLAEFFQKVKQENQDVTVVVFSEFGRTLKTNGTVGTDHGQGGGMFVFSTNSNLKSQLPAKVYGKLGIQKEKNDYFGVGVDYRSIYGRILNSLYGIAPESYFEGKYSLEKDLNITLPTPLLFRNEFRNSGGKNLGYDMKFSIDDENFQLNKAAYMDFEFGEDPENLKKDSRYSLLNSITQKDGSFKISKTLSEDKTYFYKLSVIDNQYDTVIVTGSIVPPKKIATNVVQKLDFSRDNFFQKFANTTINSEQNIEKIVLFDTEVASGEVFTGALDKSFSGGISMKFGTGETSISKLTSSGTTSWHGGFLLPKEIEKQKFLTQDAKVNGNSLLNYYTDTIVKVGADILGVGMELSQNVTLSLPIKDTSKKYRILRSEDGVNWIDISGTDVSPVNGKIDFSTNHFTYFAAVDLGNVVTSPTPTDPTLPTNPTPPTTPTDPSIPTTPTTPDTPKVYGGGGGAIIRIDRCPEGDFSPSYYDNSCEKVAYVSIKNKTKPQYKVSKLRYQGFEISQIQGYKTSKNALKMSMSLAANKNLTKSEKEILVNRVNEFLFAKFNYDTVQENREVIRAQYNKQTILLKGAMNKILKN